MKKALALTLCIAAASAAAQDGRPWFGTPAPAAASDPRKPIMKYDGVFPPVPARFAHRPGRSDELLDGAALKKDQQAIVGFSLESLAAGDAVWGRRAATPAFMRTMEWTVSQMKAAGLGDAAVETYTVLFDRDANGNEVLTDGGKTRLDSAMAEFVKYPRTSPFVVEGYAEQGTADERFLLSRTRAQLVRDYLVGKFGLDPNVVAIMPMGANAEGSPAGDRWAGVALALFVPRSAI